MQNSNKPDKPKVHDFTDDSKSNDLAGSIIMLILMVVGGFLLFNWRQVGIIPAVFGFFFLGAGVFVFGYIILYKFFILPKYIVAQLVSIDEASMYLAGFAQYILKYQDADGKLYTFYKRDINFTDLELQHVYNITVQGSKVKETGALVSASTHSIVSGPQRKSLNYMSGLYYPKDPSFREIEKIELGFMVVLLWFLQLLFFGLLISAFIPTIDIGSVIVYAVPTFLIARWLYADYVAKIETMDGTDEH